jgi:hypothetical protein
MWRQFSAKSPDCDKGDVDLPTRWQGAPAYIQMMKGMWSRTSPDKMARWASIHTIRMGRENGILEIRRQYVEKVGRDSESGREWG